MSLLSPSQNLDAIIDNLNPHRTAREVSLSGAAFNLLIDQLSAVRRQTLALEREASALRLAEAGRLGRTILDASAADQMESLVRDPDGKVLRPDFGGRDR